MLAHQNIQHWMRQVRYNCRSNRMAMQEIKVQKSSSRVCTHWCLNLATVSKVYSHCKSHGVTFWTIVLSNQLRLLKYNAFTWGFPFSTAFFFCFRVKKKKKYCSLDSASFISFIILFLLSLRRRFYIQNFCSVKIWCVIDEITNLKCINKFKLAPLQPTTGRKHCLHDDI